MIQRPSSAREPAWLDIVSYGRRGPGRRPRLGPELIAAIERTVGNVPEVMVKVTGGGRNIQQVRDEITYFSRKGELEIETDDGQRLSGHGIDKQLVEDWDLDLEALRARIPYTGKPGRRAPKIVYNLMLSMPPGTPPQKVLQAARKLAFEKFALDNRYAMVLHTDEKHPHVHMLVKARNEQGIRLYITKPMLREWRQDFARYLRELGVAANATDRKSRGQTKPRKLDGIYRAHFRGESTHMRERAEKVAAQILRGSLRIGFEKEKLIKTGKEVARGWMALSKQLAAEGQPNPARRADQFINAMAKPRTEHELVADDLRAYLCPPLSREPQPTR